MLGGVEQERRRRAGSQSFVHEREAQKWCAAPNSLRVTLTIRSSYTRKGLGPQTVNKIKTVHAPVFPAEPAILASLKPVGKLVASLLS